MLGPGECKDAVKKAIDIGFRHIDTAQYYDNEKQVGDGIAASKINRDEITIATKVWIDKLGCDDVIKSTLHSLENLHLSFVDILYIHWPAQTYNPRETLKAFSQLVDEGKVRFIGVANFTPRLINEAIEICDKPIIANQVEHHPLLQQREMRAYLEKRNMYLVAYSPLARRRILNQPVIMQIAQRHHATPSQVTLSWIMEHRAIPIPKAANPAHIQENFDSLQIKLDKEDIDKINSISIEKRIINPPGIAPPW